MSKDLLLPSIRARMFEIEQLFGRVKDACRYDEQVKMLARQEEAMSREGFWDAPQQAARIIAELKLTKSIVDDIRELESRVSDARTLFDLAEEEHDQATFTELDRDTRQLFKAVSSLELRTLLSGEYDAEGCYLSINAGAGGTEACDWVEILRRMYLRWAERRRFKTEILDELSGEEAGYKSTMILVTGPFAYGYLRAEIGVHRLVRISPYDAKSRRHTSFASVDVSPDVDESVDIEINESDLRIDTYRSSGAGGQHVNTTDSAVRITHLPTNIVVSCQNERSQHSNKAQAMRALKSRLLELELKRREEELTKMSGDKGDIAFGSQIRNYVLAPYKLVKDLRTDYETGNVDHVLDGDLDPFIEAYLRLLAKGAPSARSGPKKASE